MDGEKNISKFPKIVMMVFEMSSLLLFPFFLLHSFPFKNMVTNIWEHNMPPVTPPPLNTPLHLFLTLFIHLPLLVSPFLLLKI